MSLTDQMAQLAEGIIATRAQRLQDVAAIKPNRKKKSQKDRKDRQAAMSSLQSSISADLGGIFGEVEMIRKNTAQSISQIQKEQKKNASEKRKELQDFRSILDVQVSSMIGGLKADRLGARKAWQATVQPNHTGGAETPKKSASKKTRAQTKPKK
ncbi:hypothetical protein [Flexibacterium corallicola]|uniref:hypothetical protein n=1 Tax=Flexibacterium corallicola TaxID=3037259 RepID=UPI00286F184A|nr:hypothetical protein [Pseudovibrio sp. M1P-2-3]